MIDTIILYIHELQNYPQIIQQLEQADSRNGTSRFERIDKETGEILQGKKGSAVFYHDTESFKFRTVRDFINLPSSTFDVCYTINRNVSPPRIEFNFSIPKYIYGSNVFQFINYFDNSTMAVYELFKKFMDDFRKQFIQNIALEHIEIFRMDICYNQFFESKEAAFNYLQHQKVILTKMSNIGGSPAYYKTGLFWNSENYSFKIYHKGSEFKKNDFNSIANNSKKVKFDVSEIQLIADRILRYECSFRNSYFNYIFYQIYRDAENSKLVKDSVYFKILMIHKVNFFSNKRYSFLMRSNYDQAKNYLISAAEIRKRYSDNYNVTFNYNLFSRLIFKFWKIVDQFQVTSCVNYESINSAIFLLNKSIKLKNEINFGQKKIPLINNKRIIFWFLQSQKSSLFQLCTDGQLSEAQYYRIIKIFKQLGLSDYNPDFGFLAVTTDFQEYRSLFYKFY